MTNDGGAVLFASPDANGAQQEHLMNTDGSNGRQITAEPEGIAEAIIAGHGNIVFAASERAGLLQFDVATGARTVLAPPTPAVKSISKAAAGSLAQLTGTGLAGISSVTLNDNAVPVFSRTDTGLIFQVPWVVNPDNPALIMARNNAGSPFESGVWTTTPQLNPSFFPLGEASGASLISHQDFASLVTTDNPATPGEHLHFWMTGLGPVTGPMETGVPTSITGDPLQVVTTPFTCSVLNGETNLAAPISFAGLAPGLVGLYQMDLEFPSGPKFNPATLWCTFPNGSSALATVPVRLAQ
jgi:uncharacterized protein (TIGR03437 family)